MDGLDALQVMEAVVGLIPADAHDLARGDVYPFPGSSGRPIGDGNLTREDARQILRYEVTGDAGHLHGTGTNSPAVVIAYPAPQYANLSSDYAVQVDGQPVPVYPAEVRSLASFGGPYSFAYFDFGGGKVTVTISSSRPLDQVVVRPVAKRIAPVPGEGSISFALTEPCQLSIEPDGKNGPLLLFANPLEEEIPDPDDPDVVFYGPGIYKPGRISLRSNQTLYIAGGALVKGAVHAQGKNIAIIGRGIIDGTDWEQWKGPQGHMVQLDWCQNARVEGLILRGSWAWTLVPAGCDSVTIANVKICGSRAESDDGIDIVNSRKVVIKDSFIRTDDDCISPKGMGYSNRPVEDIEIHGCVFWTDRAHIWRIGIESQAESMRNISSWDIDVIHFRDAWFGTGPMAISLQPAEDMPMENIRFEDIRIHGENQKILIEVRPQYQLPWSRPQPGMVRNCYFKNIVVHGNAGGRLGEILVRGPDEQHTVENVTFENIYRYGQLTLEDSPGVTVSGYVSNISFISTDEAPLLLGP